ncbi:hypothetical protein [Winogradskyella sp. 3972H.M.0a.05]|uniref:hypothetical protein n=1 Tax=Winogradskyella sp. 3972H.M.0a.05 TaxID=2950277 RepID=UPI0033943CA3
MKRFLIKTILFSLMLALGFLALMTQADGSSDEFYLKLTSPKQSSLIVGSSRAAQSIQPQYINDKVEDSLYNFAFSILHSPFGKAYHDLISRKLNTQTTDGIFIIEVNPWTLSSQTEEREDSLNFREVGSFVDKTHFVSIKPNPEYLIESYQEKNLNFITKKYRRGEYQTFYVEDDGWLEVVIESDMFSTAERTKRKINSYRKKLDAQYKGFSKTRFDYLIKTIKMLQERGEVYLLRIPVNDDMYALELELMEDFDNKMERLSETYDVPYFNFMNKRSHYQYTDGHHLTIDSGKQFSEELASLILSNRE